MMYGSAKHNQSSYHVLICRCQNSTDHNRPKVLAPKTCTEELTITCKKKCSVLLKKVLPFRFVLNELHV